MARSKLKYGTQVHIDDVNGYPPGTWIVRGIHGDTVDLTRMVNGSEIWGQMQHAPREVVERALQMAELQD